MNELRHEQADEAGRRDAEAARGGAGGGEERGRRGVRGRRDGDRQGVRRGEAARDQDRPEGDRPGRRGAARGPRARRGEQRARERRQPDQVEDGRTDGRTRLTRYVARANRDRLQSVPAGNVVTARLSLAQTSLSESTETGTDFSLSPQETLSLLGRWPSALVATTLCAGLKPVPVSAGVQRRLGA